MTKAKICHLTSVHTPFDVRIFHKECKALISAGYDVVLIVPHHRDEIVDGVPIRAVKRYASRFYRFTRTAWDVYRMALHENADFYHIHDPELILIAIMLKYKGKKIIYDVHEDFPRQTLSREWIAPRLRQIVSVISEVVENASVRAFDAIIGATPYICQRFNALGCKTVNINNYPFLSKDDLIRPEDNAPLREVCYVGGVARQRGIFEMVAAIGQTNTNLIIAGNIDEKILAELQNMPEWTQVIQLGYVERQELACMLAKSIAGIVIFHPEPNHVHAQPTKMFEYMAAGLPIIASDFPYWRDIVKNFDCGLLVDPFNIQEIAEAIQWLVDNPEEAKRMGNNGRLAVMQEFNWKVEEEKLLLLYENLSSQIL